MARSIPQASGWKAVVKRLRRRSRTVLNRLLTSMMGTPEPKRGPLTGDTRRILVVRLNKRLGNILFLTPMLHALHKGLPDATIDVLIRDPNQAPLLANLPGVGQVHVQPRSLGDMWRLACRLRGQRYDLAIDPSANSTGDRVGLLLAGARQRVGIAGPDQWLRLTHAAQRLDDPHQAKRAVALLRDAIEGVDFGHWPYLSVQPDVAARDSAERYWQQALGTDTSAPVIGFFAQATGKKQLAADWWQAWLAAVRAHAPGARVLQIQPPGAAATLQPDVPGVQIAELDVLAALMARLHVFVAADSGPMHLAAASGVPTVGLFKATSAVTFAPLGAQCCALEKADLTADHVARAAVSRLSCG